VSDDVLAADAIDMALTATCSGDRPHAGNTSWSPVWEAWLCANCRACRTEAELRMPLADGKKPAPAAAGQFLYPLFRL